MLMAELGILGTENPVTVQYALTGVFETKYIDGVPGVSGGPSDIVVGNCSYSNRPPHCAAQRSYGLTYDVDNLVPLLSDPWYIQSIRHESMV